MLQCPTYNTRTPVCLGFNLSADAAHIYLFHLLITPPRNMSNYIHTHLQKRSRRWQQRHFGWNCRQWVWKADQCIRVQIWGRLCACIYGHAGNANICLRSPAAVRGGRNCLEGKRWMHQRRQIIFEREAHFHVRVIDWCKCCCAHGRLPQKGNCSIAGA